MLINLSCSQPRAVLEITNFILVVRRGGLASVRDEFLIGVSSSFELSGHGLLLLSYKDQKMNFKLKGKKNRTCWVLSIQNNLSIFKDNCQLDCVFHFCFFNNLGRNCYLIGKLNNKVGPVQVDNRKLIPHQGKKGQNLSKILGSVQHHPRTAIMLQFLTQMFWTSSTKVVK